MESSVAWYTVIKIRQNCDLEENINKNLEFEKKVLNVEYHSEMPAIYEEQKKIEGWPTL